MAALKCPQCGLFNPDTAQRCDCGYDFETQSVDSTVASRPKSGTSWGVGGANGFTEVTRCVGIVAFVLIVLTHRRWEGFLVWFAFVCTAIGSGAATVAVLSAGFQ